MSYNYSALFKKHENPFVNLKYVEASITDSDMIWRAFIWRDTTQGEDFWSRYADGENQEEGRAILTTFLNRKEIPLEDLI